MRNGEPLRVRDSGSDGMEVGGVKANFLYKLDKFDLYIRDI